MYSHIPQYHSMNSSKLCKSKYKAYFTEIHKNTLLHRLGHLTSRMSAVHIFNFVS